MVRKTTDGRAGRKPAGQAKAPPRSRKGRAKGAADASAGGAGPANAGPKSNGRRTARPADPPAPPPPIEGRLACNISRSPVSWLVPDIVPFGVLSFVVGEPQAGKSTFGAWLCAAARRPVILPGHEENVGSDLLPRLVAAGVRMESCLVLDGREWTLPDHRGGLTAVLRHHGADLLWMDPVDSYVGEISENDGPMVRTALEALARLAADVPCAVVAARHPGKALANLCPGSRQWRAVPRQIVELTVDAGPPKRRFLRPAKPYASSCQKPREYTLLGEEDEPKRFSLGPIVADADLDLAGLADVVERRKIDEAVDLVRALLKDSEQESAFVYSVAERERLSDRVMRLAARRLGVKIRREGSGKEHRSYWQQLDSGTLAQ